MTLSLESRIEKLEAKLVPSNPAERTVVIINWVNTDKTPGIVAAYSDGCGHELQREPDEEPGAFEVRATAWIRTEHRLDDPRCI